MDKDVLFVVAFVLQRLEKEQRWRGVATYYTPHTHTQTDIYTHVRSHNLSLLLDYASYLR